MHERMPERSGKQDCTWYPEVALFLFFLGLFVLSGSGRVTSADGERVYQVTRSLVQRGALDVPAYVVAPYRLVVPDYVSQQYDAQGTVGADGKYYTAGGIGMSVLAAPFYLVGAAMSWLPTGLESDYLTRLGVSLLNPVVIALLWSAFCRLLSRLFERRTAIALTLGLGMGTVFWPYSKNTFGEPLVAACLTLALLFFARFHDHRRLRDLFGASVSVALGLSARFDVLTLLPFFFVYVAVELWHRPRRIALLGTAVWVAPLVACAALLGICNWVRFGSPLESGYLAEVTTFPTPLWDGFFEQVLSPMRGLFWFNPVVVPALAGWPFFFRRRPRFAALVAALILAHLIFYCKLGLWDGGSWGSRYLVSTLPLWLLPLGALLEWRPGRKVTQVIVMLALVAGVFVQAPNVVVDEGRYVQDLYLSRGESGFRDAFYYGDVADSPLFGQWRMAQQVSTLVRSDAARSQVKEAAHKKRLELARVEHPSDALTHGISETMALSAFNFPDFWFIQIMVNGAPFWLVGLVGIPAGMLLVVGVLLLLRFARAPVGGALDDLTARVGCQK